MKRTVIKPGQVWVTRRGKKTRTPSRKVCRFFPCGKHPGAAMMVVYADGSISPRSCLVSSFKAWIRRHDAKATRTRRPRTLVLR